MAARAYSLDRSITSQSICGATEDLSAQSGVGSTVEQRAMYKILVFNNLTAQLLFACKALVLKNSQSESAPGKDFSQASYDRGNDSFMLVRARRTGCVFAIRYRRSHIV
jgi:hypothetical protein